MKVLVACEESQTVCKAFRKRGHEAYSCDLQECSGGHPEWHIQGDVIPLLNGNCNFVTAGGADVTIDGKWDLIIAHPPCTYLSNVTTRHLSLRCTSPEKVVSRMWKMAAAAVFFMQCYLADSDKVCIENPLGYMSSLFRPADQIISPYMFARSVNDTENYVTKRTCLWLRGLPLLDSNNGLSKPDTIAVYGRNPSGKISCWEERVSGKDLAKIRSKTFPGIANAMAEQWG